MAYSVDLRERAVAVAKEKGKSAAARLLSLDRGTVREWVERAEAGKLGHDTSPGRPRLIGGEAERLLEAQVEARNDATLAEHCEEWAAKGQGEVSRATMHRSLGRLGLSRKKDRPSQ
jgi:transposase